MQRLTIHNFGPIREAIVEVTPFMVLIGPQAAGKSTISKLVYYFLHLRDEVMEFVVEAAETEGTDWQQAGENLEKRLRNRFIEFWGTSPQPADMRVAYRYTADFSLEIVQDGARHRFVTPQFSRRAWERVEAAFHHVREAFLEYFADGYPSALSSVDRLAWRHQRTALLNSLRKEFDDLFGYDKELLFIPAGRSLLSTLSDQIQYIHPHKLDYPMRQFVDFVNTSNAFFDRSLDDIIHARQALYPEPIKFSEVKRARDYVSRILKGEYFHDREGGKLYVSPEVFTKLNYASSGQQESVWILLSLFLLVLERKRSLVVIEEPEAHLFTTAQHDVARFIAFVHNAIGCDFIITTHSPYLLASFNNLLYAGELAASGRVRARQVEKIIPRRLWLRPEKVSGYFVKDDGTLEPLMDSDLSLMRTELVDVASDAINEEYSALLALEGA